MSKAVVGIEYCTKCRFVLRATWIAQELLFTFEDKLQAVSLQPGGSGVFKVTVNGETVWDRETDGGFPETKALKQRIRDLAVPDLDLGHSDRKK